MKKKLHLCCLLIYLIAANHINTLYAQMVQVNTGYTPTQLVQDVFLGGGCVQVQNITYTGGSSQRAYFSNGNGAIGLNNGVLLTTGNATSVPQGISGSSSDDMPGGGDATLNTLANGTTYDAAVLEFDFRPTIANISFQYAFASEEYPEYVCSSFNDVFGFFISGPGIAGTQNIALVPTSSLYVGINTVNPGVAGAFGATGCTSLAYSTYYNSGNANMAFDGYTDIFTANAVVQPCQWYHIKLAIADEADGILDSGVFLAANSFSAGSNGVSAAGNVVINGQSYTGDAYEGCVPGQIVFSRSDPTDTSAPLTLTYTLGGSATNITDYTATPNLTGTITIPAGQVSVTVNINAISDGLAEGTETITVTLPGNNCTCTGPQSTTINIYNYTPVSVSVPPIAAVCSGQNTTVAAAVTGGIAFPAYNYTWSTGATTASISVNPSTATTYSVTVTDFCGSSATANTTVNLSPPLTINVAPLNPACGQSNGEVAVSVSSGTGPYTYTWSPASLSGANPTGLGAGTYSVTVTGAGGCSASGSTTLAPSTGLTAILTPTPTSCGITIADGSLALNTNATGSPTITWSGPTTIPAGTSNPTGLSVGTYTVTVSSGGACTATATATVAAGPTPTASLSATPTSCSGAADGGISLTTSATGTPTITWGGPTAIAAGATSASNLATGTYTVTVSTGGACTVTASATVAPGPNINATLFPTNTTCNGAANGQFTLSIDGGLSISNTQWSGPTVIAAGAQNPTNLAVGNYSVTVTASNGCTAVASAAIAPGPNVTASLSPTPSVCNSSLDGSANLNITNGTPPYNTTWTSTPSWAAPGAGTTTATGLYPGTYNVTVTESGGCTASATTVVAPGPPISVSLSPTNPTCGGTNNGSISVNANGGNVPYYYDWNPASLGDTGNPTNLASGNYTVTVTSDNGCSASASIALSPPAALTASIQATNGTCAGGGNGALNLTVGGGQSPYTFAWNNGLPAQEDHSNVAAGSYSVTVTDNSGCTATATATITIPTPMSAAITPTDIVCNGVNTGSLNLTVSGGSPSFVYAWSGGLPAVEDPANVAAGTYTVTVTDAQNCTATATATINQPTPLSVSLSATDITCNAANNGTLTATASGGTPNYTYAWSNPALSGANPSNIAAGTYTVTVSDANNCTASATITIAEPPALTAQLNANNVTCAGANNGALVVVASGGTPNYTYTWSDPTLSGANPINVAAGAYTVTVSDANGCTAVASATIIAPVAVNVSLIATPAQCGGVASGTLSASASGGTTPYTYMWSNPALSGANPSNVAAGTYTVTVSDNSGCTASATATIDEPSPLVVSVSFTDITCNNANNGTLSTTVSGGTPNYSYAWSGGLAPVANPTGAAPGLYIVTVTDANGCTANASAVISQAPALNLILVPTPSLCNAADNGTISTVVSGGTPNYSYNWSNGLPAQDSQSGLAPATYTVTVTDANGCTVQGNTTINQPTPLSGSANATTANCGQNNGSATVSVSGGTPAYNYAWSPPISSTSATANNLGAGSYSVTVTDANGCSTEIPVAVSNLNGPQLSIDNTANTTCALPNGSISVTASGGTPPLTINWSHSATFHNATANNLPAGSYTITVIDGNGCEANQSVTLTDAPPPTVALTPTNPSCELNNGSMTATVSGGTAPYSYTWSAAGGNNETLANIGAGTYSVTVSDANGCSASASASLVSSLNPTLTAALADATCGLSNGSINLTTANGVAPFSYTWLPSNIGNTSNASNLAGGTYSVTVTDANGCTDSNNFTINNATAPQITVDGVSNASCQQANGSISLSVSSGTAPFNYNWSGGLGNTPTPLFLAGGTYSVTVTDANGCTDTETINITDTPLPALSIVNQTQATCNTNNGAVTVIANNGTAPFDYQWGAPLNVSGASQSNLAGGTYTVVVTDANGCTDDLSVNLSAAGSPSVTGSANNASCGNSNGNISLTVTGGTGAITYQWSPEVTTSDYASSLSAGNYNVTVTDANGCSSFAAFTLADSPAPTIVLNNITNTTCGANNGAISITAGGGALPYGYDWTGTILNTANINNLAAGTYTTTVTDGNNCQSTATYTITDTPAPAISPGTLVAATCNNANGSASVVATGGTAPLSYSWSAPGGNTPTLANVAAGSYSITVTDSNGCTDTETLNVTNIAGATLQSPVIVNESCGNANGSITITATGGTAPYTYTWNNNALLNNASNTNLSAATYSVTVSDSNNCTASASGVISNAAPPTLSLVNTTQAACGQSNGTATVATTGGTAPYTYTWSHNAALNNATASNLSAAGYSVTVTDNNGCQAVLPVAITNAGGPTVGISGTTPDACGQGIGSIAVTAVGGTPPLNYSWSHNGALNSPNANALLTGDYFVTVADANGCQAVATATVSNQAAPTIAVSSITPSNCGNNDGAASVTVTGGTGIITYTWTPDVANSASANNIAAGNYSVVVSDVNNCTATVSFTVDNNPNPTLAPDNSTPAACGQNNGSASVVASGGQAPYNYTWEQDPALNSAIATNLAVGSYAVTVSDANGCQATTSVVVGSLNSPQIVIDNVSNETCDAANGSISLSVTGGTAPYSYTWSHDAALNSATATNLSANTYTVTITDDMGCQAVENIDIVNAPSVVISIDNITAGTCGNSNGSATISLNGGTAPYSFVWSNGVNTQNLSNVAEGCYTVTVTDNAGCTATAEACVGNSIAPVLQIDSNNAATCGNNNGSASVSVSSNTGTAPFSYAWTGSATVSNTANNLAGGNYSVTVTDALGCTNSSSLVIAATASPEATGSSTPAACGQADGSATVAVIGGSTPYTYTWQNAVSVSETANNLAAGSYGVTVTDNNSCTDAIIIDVSNEGGPQITATDNTTATCGQANGSATVTASGGTGTLTYTWQGGLSATNSATGLLAGDYSVTVADANNCQVVSSITVPGTTNPTLVLDNSNGATCGQSNGSAVVLATGGTAPYNTYNWLPNVSAGATANDIAAGDYSVTVTDNSGCSGSTSFTIGDTPSVLVSEGTIEAASCGNADGAASVVVSGGTAPYTYAWEPNVSTSETANDIAAGAYAVTVTDNAGCAASITLNVNNQNGPTASMAATPSVCDLAQGTATITVNGGTEPYTYTWSHDAALNSATANNLNPGDYSATVTDANGCIVTVAATVEGSIPPPVISCGTITDSSVEFVWEAVPGAINYEITVNGTTETVPSSQLSYEVSGLGVMESVTINIISIGGANCGESAAATWTCASTGCPEQPLTINGLAATYCINAAAVTLSGTPAGGTFSGAGIVGNIFDPTTAGIGAHSINYDYTAADGCTYNTTQSVTVVALPEPGISQPNALCVGDAGAFVFSGIPVTGATYLWNFGTAGIRMGVGPHDIAWNTTGEQPISLTMTTPEGCSATSTASIPVSSASVTLNANSTNIDLGSSTVLTATAISALNGDISYTWTPENSLSCNNCPEPVATPGAATTYTVLINDEYGCEASASLLMNVVYRKAVIIPNAFSPNGDNLNNLFRPQGLNIKEVYLEIRNRWGNKLYGEKISDLNAQGWDGKFDGKEVDMGVYVYYVEVTFTDDSQEFLKGNVTLVR
jgi:gliding motility-associated-like protein